MLDPATLAWAQSQAAGSEARVLASAYVSGTMRVKYEGGEVEYRSMAEMAQALTALRGAAQTTARRPAVTRAITSRGYST